MTVALKTFAIQRLGASIAILAPARPMMSVMMATGARLISAQRQGSVPICLPMCVTMEILALLMPVMATQEAVFGH
jgi:uncharacterized protein with ACT and thioredoxin-like domain